MYMLLITHTFFFPLRHLIQIQWDVRAGLCYVLPKV